MKNNLIQNFYIVGLPPSDFFHLKSNNKGEFLNIFNNKNEIELIPKMISKFPPKNSNFNGIDDEIVINHCFPNGFTIIKSNKENKIPINFEFELDNFLFNYSLEEKNIYSKIYFSCLEIYEPLTKYFKYKNDILDIYNKKLEIINDIEELDDKYKCIYIPKVICFSSILPFYKELNNILITIYKLYSDNLSNNNIIPLEKLIEQIVLKIPIPLMNNTHIELLFKLNDPDNVLLNSNSLNKISFPLFNIKERNLQLYYSNPIIIFKYFSADDIMKIFKFILLEIPLLFFCDNKTLLSSFIETFISLLSPFKYVLPYNTILPKKLYGLINTESKFLFGINEKYSPNFFQLNDIEIDKNIIIININELKIEEVTKEINEDNNNFFIIQDDAEINNENYDNDINYVKNDYVVYNGTKIDLVFIELPYIKKKLYEDLNNYINKKSKKNDEDDFNYKIRSIFYKFFVYLLAGYSDSYLNSKYFYESLKSKNCGNEILFKTNNEKDINDFNFVKELFNVEEFINKYPKDQLFYFVFFQTKMFVNFLRERIYVNDKINSMQYKQFDQLTFLKKHEDHRKKKENKGVYEDFKKKPQDKTKEEHIKEISIISDDFNENEKEQILSKDRKKILIKYGQYINNKEKNKKKKEHNDNDNNKISINYSLFPKLLFDDECFNIKYENIFFMHGIDIPNSKTVEDYKLSCSSLNDEYNKLRRYMFTSALVDKKPSTNCSKANFEVTSYYYIYFNWIILLCCSLWYCEPIERIIRLDEILFILDKLNYIEDIVLKLLYKTFLKYGNKNQCIKVHEKVVKFMGHSNYLYLNILCNKLCEKENEINNVNENLLHKKFIKFENDDNKNKDNKYYFKDRSLILGLESFIQKRISTPVKNNSYMHHRMARSTTNFALNQRISKNINIEKNKNKENNYKEKIVFSSEQYCGKCQSYIPFDFEEIKQQKLSKMLFYYKCNKCKTVKNDVTIKYQILLYNKRKKDLFITKMGEFKLLPPNRLYQELMYHITSKKDWAINIENIFTEKQINIINFIYYFSTQGISFDFLIPYKTLSDENVELIQNNLGAIISDINRRRFSLLEISEYDKINKSLTMNTDNDDFIPIDISNNDNLNRYNSDLVPCLINYYYDIYNEGEELENNDEDNNNNNVNVENDNDDGQNYFTINPIKK